jgi:hypothetical protein
VYLHFDDIDTITHHLSQNTGLRMFSLLKSIMSFMNSLPECVAGRETSQSSLQHYAGLLHHETKLNFQYHHGSLAHYQRSLSYLQCYVIRLRRQKYLSYLRNCVILFPRRRELSSLRTCVILFHCRGELKCPVNATPDEGVGSRPLG